MDADGEAGTRSVPHGLFYSDHGPAFVSGKPSAGSSPVANGFSTESRPRSHRSRPVCRLLVPRLRTTYPHGLACLTWRGADLSSLVAAQTDRASLHAAVSGIVQGVFYRRFVLREATALGLHGRVRNLHDGRVEVEAEGERRQLVQLTKKLHEGPSGAQVTGVVTDWSEYQQEYEDFQVDYL
jgi:acylphosphatase